MMEAWGFFYIHGTNISQGCLGPQVSMVQKLGNADSVSLSLALS